MTQRITVRRRFVQLPHGQVHYRVGGTGPPVVLLHDSPRSSVMHLPQFQWLGERFTVLALDTPGYGNSTPLPSSPVPTIPDFATALGDTLHALGVAPCPVYGFHTSSKIALELATREPASVSGVIVDGLSLPAALPDEFFIERYMKPFMVSADGSHLAAQWTKVLDFHRFFPWFEQAASTRLAMDLPDDEHLQRYCMDTLMAGAAWSSAYAAAMRYPAREALSRLRVPVTFTCRADDVLARFLDDLPSPLPPGCELLRIGSDPADWRKLIGERLQHHLPPGAAPLAGRNFAAAVGRSYVDLPEGQLHLRICGTGERPAMLMLHDLPGSAVGLEPLAAELSVDRMTWRCDLPGSGESDALPDAVAEAYVNALLLCIEHLGPDPVDLYARHLATPLALALAAAAGARIRRVILDGCAPLAATERTALMEHYCPSLRPRRDGIHLLTAWHQLRDREFSWPWYDRSAAAVRRRRPDLEPARLHAETVDILKQPEHYGDALAASLAMELPQLCAQVTQPVLLLNDPLDLRDAGLEAVAAVLPNARLMRKDESVAGQGRQLRSFLDA